jgi:hypothetical protein
MGILVFVFYVGLYIYIYMFLRGEGLYGEYAAFPISSSILLLLFFYSFLSYKLTEINDEDAQ